MVLLYDRDTQESKFENQVFVIFKAGGIVPGNYKISHHHSYFVSVLILITFAWAYNGGTKTFETTVIYWGQR